MTKIPAIENKFLSALGQKDRNLRWPRRRDKQTDGRTPYRYITLSSRRGQRKNVIAVQNAVMHVLHMHVIKRKLKHAKLYDR